MTEDRRDSSAMGACHGTRCGHSDNLLPEKGHTMSLLINVKDPIYGAQGDGITNDTQAFIAASAALSAQGGGTLYIPPGVYIVGEQTFAGQAGLGYAYLGKDIIYIHDCDMPVVIQGEQAVLKAAPGLKFGSFDPVTGDSYEPASMPFIDSDYAASTYRMIVVVNNRQVVIRDLELDGQSDTIVLGGGWGDLGRQLNAYGVYSFNSQNLRVENVHTHHHGLDGVMVLQVGTTAESPRTPATLINVRSEYNARQGLSWCGGNGLTAIDCQFNHTGRGGFFSSPAAGIDIEASEGVVRNGLFINCEIINNVGVGFLADTGDSADITLQRCTLIGSTNYPIWPRKPRIHFMDCTLSGQIVNTCGEQTPGDGQATRFTGCYLTDQITYNNQVHMYPGWYLLDLGGGSLGVSLDHCTIHTGIGALMYTGGQVILDSCNLIQTTTYTCSIEALFSGQSKVQTAGVFGNSGLLVIGRLLCNGQEMASYQGAQWRLYLQGNNGSATGSRQTQGYAYDPSAFTGVDSALQGDIIYNTAAVAGGYAGWICVGEGQWKPFGAIAN